MTAQVTCLCTIRHLEVVFVHRRVVTSEKEVIIRFEIV